VNFAGDWWLGAALVAVLAHVYIFYGFESAGDIAEEVRDPSRKVRGQSPHRCWPAG